MQNLARTLFFGSLSLLAFGLLGGPPDHAALGADTPPSARTVYLARDLPDEGLITLSVAVAAADPSGVVLLDSPKLSPYTKAFLATFKPAKVVPVGSFPGGT